MAESAQTITSTTRYPVYATKTAYLTDLRQAIEQHSCDKSRMVEILYRLSNTDTDNWTADSDARHDD